MIDTGDQDKNRPGRRLFALFDNSTDFDDSSTWFELHQTIIVSRLLMSLDKLKQYLNILQ